MSKLCNRRKGKLSWDVCCDGQDENCRVNACSTRLIRKWRILRETAEKLGIPIIEAKFVGPVPGDIIGLPRKV